MLNPGGPDRLVGRARVLAEVEDLVGRSRVLTLVGFGGAGKTGLAREVVARRGQQWATGGWFVPLAGIRDPAIVGPTVAGVLRLHVPGDGWDADLLAEHLGTRSLLLVLDNCEHLVDAVAALVEVLVARCPEVTVLATSRVPLRIAAETVYDVPPLSPPPADGSLHPLTAREGEVVALIAEGLTNKAIAERLHISERTVHGHVEKILQKLDAGSRARAAAWYVGRTGG